MGARVSGRVAQGRTIKSGGDLTMLARALRRLLLIELIIYIAFGWSLVHGAGWTTLAAGTFVLGFALGIRALGIALTFALAGRYDAKPPGNRIGFGGWLRTYFAELGAYIALYTLLQPFEALFTRAQRPCPPAQAQLPVLLLHGYICNRGFMLPLQRFFERHGLTTFSHNLEPVYAGIDSYCDGLARRIEEICAATGAGKVVILGHSMGGLAARAYLRQHGAARVAALITLGTPHHGTALARLGAGENASQMVPGSAWLRLLNQHLIAIPVVSVFSHQDNIVSPRDSAALAGAKLVELYGVGHLTMAFSRRVREIALREISAVS
ncbi:MAG TPA: alpha/beta fold hydrolase [Burkholderiales bacterium]|nr:alpha/beta fold hydrolase [Burkholderiales bacterium]